MYIYIYVYMCVCIYICVCDYICVYRCISVCVCVYTCPGSSGDVGGAHPGVKVNPAFKDTGSLGGGGLGLYTILPSPILYDV